MDGISDPFISRVCSGSVRSMLRRLRPGRGTSSLLPSKAAFNISFSEGFGWPVRFGGRCFTLPAANGLVEVGEVGLLLSSAAISTGTKGPPVFLDPPRDLERLRSTCAPKMNGQAWKQAGLCSDGRVGGGWWHPRKRDVTTQDCDLVATEIRNENTTQKACKTKQLK